MRCWIEPRHVRRDERPQHRRAAAEQREQETAADATEQERQARRLRSRRTFPAVFNSMSRVSGSATNATAANIATMLSTKCVSTIVYGAFRFRLSRCRRRCSPVRWPCPETRTAKKISAVAMNSGLPIWCRHSKRKISVEHAPLTPTPRRCRAVAASRSTRLRASVPRGRDCRDVRAPTTRISARPPTNRVDTIGKRSRNAATSPGATICFHSRPSSLRDQRRRLAFEQDAAVAHDRHARAQIAHVLDDVRRQNDDHVFADLASAGCESGAAPPGSRPAVGSSTMISADRRAAPARCRSAAACRRRTCRASCLRTSHRFVCTSSRSTSSRALCAIADALQHREMVEHRLGEMRG